MDSESNNNFSINKRPRPSLKFAPFEDKIKDTNDNNPKVPTPSLKKRLSWDVEGIEAQEIERLKNPKRKIDEPKTPYVYHEDEDNTYLSKLTEINKLQPTKDILDLVCQKLQIDSKVTLNPEEDNKMDVDSDHNEIVGKSQENEKKKNDFMNKRNQAYRNEFTMARKFKEISDDNEDKSQDKSEKSEDDEDDEELINETLQNTLYNKFYGKINK